MTRRHGTGSLYQRRDGRWIGRLPDGRGGHVHFTGTDPDDVERRMDAARRERDRTTSSGVRGAERLRDLADRYMTTVAPIVNAPRTVEDHAQVLRDHILPVIGSVHVPQLTARDAQRVVTRMQGRGYAPKTIQNAVRVLSAVLRHAEREQSIPTNVARLVVVPAVPRERLPMLTTEQVMAFLDATRDDELWPAWVLCATTAMRISEVLGLLWRDVSWDEQGRPDKVAITGQYRLAGTRADGSAIYHRQTTKTPGSKATMYLPPRAVEAMLRAHRDRRSLFLVFARRGGDLPYNRSWVNEQFRHALARHGLPPVRLHSLRHAAVVALLDANGGDIRDAMHLARHASVKTTIDVYGQDADAARKRAAEALGRAHERRAKNGG